MASKSWKGGNNEGSIFEIVTFQGIALIHLNRCIINGSQEWHGGYWTENPETQEKTYIPNSREVFSNSVKMLKAILKPHFDQTMEIAEKNFETKLKDLFTKYNNTDRETYPKEEYLNDRIAIYIKLFEKLNELLKRTNYLEQDSYGESDLVMGDDLTEKEIDVKDFIDDENKNKNNKKLDDEEKNLDKEIRKAERSINKTKKHKE